MVTEHLLSQIGILVAVESCIVTFALVMAEFQSARKGMRRALVSFAVMLADLHQTRR